MIFRRRRKSLLNILPWLLLPIFTELVSAGGASLKGADLSCNQPDGRDVSVPGITDTKDMSRLSIRCICHKKVVRCERQVPGAYKTFFFVVVIAD